MEKESLLHLIIQALLKIKFLKCFMSKVKMSTIWTSISSEAIYPFLELQYSYPSWAQTSEYGTIQRSIAVYGQYKHGPYIPFYGLASIFPHTQRSLLCLRLECSSARGALCHDDSCDFDSNTFTSYFTSSVNQYCTEVQLSFCATMTLGVQLPFMGSMGVVKAGVIEWGQQDDFEKE